MRPRTVAEERASIHQECDRFYEGYDELAELLDALLLAHAHELAEQIRAMEDGVVHMSGRRVTDVNLVADLLDPEVS